MIEDEYSLRILHLFTFEPPLGKRKNPFKPQFFPKLFFNNQYPGSHPKKNKLKGYILFINLFFAV